MEKNRDADMLKVCCCGCGRWINESASGTWTKLTCPKCGADLEVQVEGKAVMVALLRTKAQRLGASIN